MRRRPWLAAFLAAASVLAGSLTTAYLRGHDQFCAEPTFGGRCSPPQDPWVLPCELLAAMAAVACVAVVLARFTSWVVRG